MTQNWMKSWVNSLTIFTIILCSMSCQQGTLPSAHEITSRNRLWVEFLGYEMNFMLLGTHRLLHSTPLLLMCARWLVTWHGFQILIALILSLPTRIQASRLIVCSYFSYLLQYHFVRIPITGYRQRFINRSSSCSCEIIFRLVFKCGTVCSNQTNKANETGRNHAFRQLIMQVVLSPAFVRAARECFY